ncbi:MAG: DNA/RNA non-specific endonuclease [Bacteroidales bacterium]|nr:DNA/RNA non-specific endonuclease [Bacteroidales bacterium]
MKRILSLSLLALLLCACTEKLATVSDPVTLSASAESLTPGGGSLFLRVQASGDWAIQILEGAEWAELSTRTGSGNKNGVVLTYEANTGTSERILRVALDADGSTASLTLKQAVYSGGGGSGSGGGSGGDDSGGGDSGGGSGYGKATASAHWLELPQTSASDGLEFFSRNCSISGKTLRNYAFYWDYTNRVSHWVAYPLCSAYLGSQGRSEAWGYDPLLPAASQQNVSGGYREGNNGWYARGHQLPSADRTANYSLNASTFYGTNMTPQNQDFNGGVWATLEGKVRSWASASDTLYVVTGCVVDGATHYALDRSGVRITVPTAYFKAVLRYQKNSTLGHGGYMGAAFWYDHETVNWSGKSFSKAQSLSIKELETKLGYDLFVNLPGVVGQSAADEIEKEKPSTVNWWW